MREFHPIADLFPLMDETRLQELVESIKSVGLLEPIVLFEGKVLDGRNRLTACERAGIQSPGFEMYEGDSPVAFVLAKNMHRRDLTTVQRIKIAESARPRLEAEAKARMKAGKATLASRDARVENGKTAGKIAQIARTSQPTVERYQAVQEDGIPELQAAVEAGTVPIKTGARIASLPPKNQAAALAETNGNGHAKARRPKSGKPLFDDRLVPDAFGRVIRLLDARASALGKHDEHEKALHHLDLALAAYKRWTKAT